MPTDGALETICYRLRWLLVWYLCDCPGFLSLSLGVARVARRLAAALRRRDRPCPIMREASPRCSACQVRGDRACRVSRRRSGHARSDMATDSGPLALRQSTSRGALSVRHRQSADPSHSSNLRQMGLVHHSPLPKAYQTSFIELSHYILSKGSKASPSLPRVVSKSLTKLKK